MTIRKLVLAVWVGGFVMVSIGCTQAEDSQRLESTQGEDLQSSAAAQTADSQRPTVGSTAPDFVLHALGGEEVQLTRMLEEGPVVLIQLRGWVGEQCPICTRQVGEFMGRIGDFQMAGANILAVYPGPEGELQEYAEDFVRGETIPENFYLLLDPGLRFTDQYGLRWDAPDENAYPATFLIDQDGSVRFAKISDNYGDRAGADTILALLDGVG